MKKLVNWFQIPAINLERATKFYADILGATFHPLENEMGRHAFFAFDSGDGDPTGGEIIQSAYIQPANTGGVVLFFNAPTGIAAALAAVERSGGKVVMPKTAIGGHGLIAVIVDTEGNTIGLHSVVA